MTAHIQRLDRITSSMKITFAFLFLLAVTPVCVISQVQNTAAKFDEFSDNTDAYEVIDRGNRLARQLRLEPVTTKAFIIFYNKRKGRYPAVKGDEWAASTKGILVNGYQISPSRIIIKDGGYREHTTLEYWMVPGNADHPEPTPTFGIGDVVYCPEINVASDQMNFDPNKPLKFSVLVKDASPDAQIGFHWNASAGEIINGQGKNAIEVKLSSTTPKVVSASVQISGLSPECNSYGASTVELGLRPFKLTEIRYNLSYFKAVLDYLYSVLNTDPELRGYIIVYGSRTGTDGELRMRIDAARQYVRFRQYDPARISIVSGERREYTTVEIYVIPKGVSNPPLTPSVDERFVTRPKSKRTGKMVK
jgi:hypothetical protein